jgi:integrase
MIMSAKTAIRSSNQPIDPNIEAKATKFIDSPRILNLLIKLQNLGKSDGTIKATDTRLKIISKHADLDNPDTVTKFITHMKTGNNYKIALIRTYIQYCKHYNLTWNPPKYTSDTKAIKIPPQPKLDQLIANSGKTLATKLRISKETGLRPVELMNLKVKDIALEQRTIYPTTAKHGSSRSIVISTNLRDTIQCHINRSRLQLNDKLFKGTALDYGHAYRQMRNRLSDKLNDPSLKQIRLYDFRHYFATTLYHKYKDLLLVKQQMGHKRVETTLIYTQLLNAPDDEYISKTATNIKEAQNLIESGFEYVTEIDGTKLFRKRK